MRTPRRLCLHTTNAVQRALLWAFALVFAVQSVAYATMVTMPNAVGSGSVTQFVRTAQAADRAPVHAHVHHDVVRRIDAANGKVTIKHDEIVNLDMPGMTMVFKLQDKAQATGLSVGQAVRFHVEMEGDAMVITQIEAAQ
jgi:Cu(I)/Ag(I) efflux system periplasmic protein CusF